MFDYFYGAQAEQFSFYRVPKVLFAREQFRDLSPGEKHFSLPRTMNGQSYRLEQTKKQRR